MKGILLALKSYDFFPLFSCLMFDGYFCLNLTDQPAVCRVTVIVGLVDEAVIEVLLAKYVNCFDDILHDMPQI